MRIYFAIALYPWLSTTQVQWAWIFVTETEIHFGHDSPASARAAPVRQPATEPIQPPGGRGHRSSVGHSFVMRCVLAEGGREREGEREREREREGERAVRISISNYVLLCLREKDWDAREAHTSERALRGGR